MTRRLTRYDLIVLEQSKDRFLIRYKKDHPVWFLLEQGFIEAHYEGFWGFLGFAKLRRTKAGDDVIQYANKRLSE